MAWNEIWTATLQTNRSHEKFLIKFGEAGTVYYCGTPDLYESYKKSIVYCDIQIYSQRTDTAELSCIAQCPRS